MDRSRPSTIAQGENQTGPSEGGKWFGKLLTLCLGKAPQAIARWKERKREKTPAWQICKEGGKKERGDKERRKQGDRKEGRGRGEGRIQNAGVRAQEVNLAEIYPNKKKDFLTQTSYYRGTISAKAEAKERIMKQMNEMQRETVDLTKLFKCQRTLF